MDGSQGVSCVRDCSQVRSPRQAEVGDFDRTVRGNQQVSGFDVAMNHVALTRSFKPERGLAADVHRPRYRQPAYDFQQIGDAGWKKFHCDVVSVIVLEHLVNSDHVGVVYARHQHSFALKSLNGVFTAKQPVRGAVL